MEPIAIGAFVGFVVVAGCFGYLYRKNAIDRKMGISKSPSGESLNTMTDPV
jgi:uncharacterized membrane protein